MSSLVSLDQIYYVARSIAGNVLLHSTLYCLNDRRSIDLKIFPYFSAIIAKFEFTNGFRPKILIGILSGIEVYVYRIIILKLIKVLKSLCGIRVAIIDAYTSRDFSTLCKDSELFSTTVLSELYSINVITT